MSRPSCLALFVMLVLASGAPRADTDRAKAANTGPISWFEPACGSLAERLVPDADGTADDLAATSAPLRAHPTVLALYAANDGQPVWLEVQGV